MSCDAYGHVMYGFATMSSIKWFTFQCEYVLCAMHVCVVYLCVCVCDHAIQENCEWVKTAQKTATA